MEEHGESSADDVSNALKSGKLKSLVDILKVCRDGGLHKNNNKKPLKGVINETPNHKQMDAHQKARKSDQYPEDHSLASIRRKRRRSNDSKSLANVISTCRSEGRQAFHDVANVPASDLARIEELQQEMGVDIANTKIHISDAKLRRRQSKLSVSSSGTILTETGSGCVVSVGATTTRDSSLPSTTKSSSKRTPIIPPEGEISSEDWLQIRMRNRSKRYRQSKSELLKGNRNLDRDITCTGDSTTTDTMAMNLVTHLENSDTFNEDTSGDGMNLTDPQLAAEKKVDGSKVTKMTDENMRSNEQNYINSDINSEKANVIEEVKIKDGNVTLVLYKVKEESFLKMKHEYQNSESKGKMDDSISIRYNNQHDCTDTYKSEDACNSSRTHDNVSPLKDTYTETDLPDSAAWRRSHSSSRASEAYNLTRTNDNSSPLKDTNIEQDATDSNTRRRSHSSSRASEAYNSTRTNDNCSSLNDTSIKTDDTDSDRRRGSHSSSMTSDVPIESQMKTNNEGVNNKRGVIAHINIFIPNTFNYSQARTAPVLFEQNTSERSESNTDIHRSVKVLITVHLQSEKDVVNGNTSYATVSSECIKASNDDDFEDSNILNTSTNKTEMTDDRINTGTTVTNNASTKHSPGFLVSSEMDLGDINEDRVTKDKHKTSDTYAKPNDAARLKPVSKNVISNIQERNGSKETDSMQAMSTNSFPMSMSNKTTQKNKASSTSASRMSGMSPAAREILLKQSLKQINDNAIKSQGNFLNVLSSFRSDMQMIKLDLKSDKHIKNTLVVETDVEKKTPEDTLDKDTLAMEEGNNMENKTPENTLDIEPAIIDEASDTESEADDKEEKNIVARQGHKIDTDPNREIIARLKRTSKSNITSKWSPGHKSHTRPAKENSSSVSIGDDKSQVEQELRLLRQKIHLMKTLQASRVYEDEAKRLNPMDNVFVGNEYDLSTKSNAVQKQYVSKSSQNNVKH